MDTVRGYSQFPHGTHGTAVAVYCRECCADMSVCKEDVPDIDGEQVAAMWNRRAAPPKGETP